MKLYKNTVYVCLVFALVTMIAAVVIEFFSPAHFLLLLQNFCIGLSCSSILVIVPTFLQYHDIKSRELKDLGDLLHDISTNIVFGSCDDLTDGQYRTIAEHLLEQFQQLLHFQMEYTTILPSERKGIANLIAPVLKYSIDFILKEQQESYVTAVRNLGNSEKGKEIVEITLQLISKNTYRGIFDEYLKEFENTTSEK